MAEGTVPPRHVAEAVAPIRGWTSLAEIGALYAAVRDVGRDHRPVTVVEIGSYEGRSTVALALAVRDAGGGRVHAIDPHGPGSDRYEVFLDNLRRAGVAELVEPLRTTSRDARWRFEDRSVDVLFVDGSHEYEVVSRDLFDWTSALADGAIAAFNDPFWPGVNRALRERVARVGSPFRLPAFVGNTLLFRYEPGRSFDARDARDLRRVRALLRVGRPLRGPHRRPEAYRRAPRWVRRAEGLAIDGLLGRFVAPFPPAPRPAHEPDAARAVETLLQAAIRGRAGRLASLAADDIEVRVRAGREERVERGDAGRDLLGKVAPELFADVPDAEWAGAVRGDLVEVSFKGSAHEGPVAAAVRARVRDGAVAALRIETDRALPL